MGYGSPGGVETFLALKDTPETYSGQALKLAKVNAGETALSLDLLLSFTDWYAGGAPTSYPWVFEAPRPKTSSDIYFSPIIKDDIGQFIVYIALGYDTEYFYRYNITTKQWHRLADSPVPLYHTALSLSPDGSKLAGQGINNQFLYIYDIEGNAWTTSPAAPEIDGVNVEIMVTVWTDDDTVWCQVRKAPAANKVKCFEYVVSTTTWSDFPNDITPDYDAGWGMAVNSAGTILYVSGIGAALENFLKYTIATDNYGGGTFGGSYDPLRVGDRGPRLWILVNATAAYHYWNCDTDTKITNAFPGNPQGIVCGHFGVIYDGDRSILGWVRTGDEPTIMSYFGTGTWKLAQKVLTDYNLVVFKKPTDGYAILAIDKANGFTIPIYRFTTLALPAGTWEFFYPKEGDYTKLKISGSELK